MSAGLPGLGLGGLFFILSALVAPVFELGRMARGRSSVAARRAVARQFAQAALMVVAIDLTLRLAFVCLSSLDLGHPPRADALTVLPMKLIGITAGILALVLCAAKSMDLISRPRTPPVPAPARGAPVRALLATGAVAAAWFVLLGFGASDLSPLSGGGGSPGAASPGPAADNEAEGPTIAARSGFTPPIRIARTAQSSVAAAAGRSGAQPPAAAEAGPPSQAPTGSAPSVKGHAAAPTTGNGTVIVAGTGSSPGNSAATPQGTSPGATGIGGGPPADAGPPAASSASSNAGPPVDAGPPAGKPAEGRALGQTR